MTLAEPSAAGPLIVGAGERGVLARGLGRSYGDAAQNAGGRIFDMPSLPPSIRLDGDLGEAVVGAGVSLDAVMRACVRHGWFVPVTPGTRHVTIGGAIAADIHGKNHHVDGSFAQHVRAFGLTLADGSHRTVTSDSPVFWATAGGMGLTGVITEAVVQMVPVQTSKMLVTTERAADLDAILSRMEETDASTRYSVAWVDLVAQGRQMGRSVLTLGDHAPLDALSVTDGRQPLQFNPREVGGVPAVVPTGLLNSWSIRAFNEMWFRKAPRRRVDEVQSIAAFFHPLDGLRAWNRLYGPRGFLQYQFVLPFGEETRLRRIVERLSAGGAPSFLAILKRFGPASPGYLSFPQPGWTLALDIPANVSGLAGLLDELDRTVLDGGGRIYLAKDSRVAADSLPRMYPRLAEWQAIQQHLDPTARFQSDLSRRLHLTK